MAVSESTKRAIEALEQVMTRATLTAECLVETGQEQGSKEPKWIGLYSTTVHDIDDAINALLGTMQSASQ